MPSPTTNQQVKYVTCRGSTTFHVIYEIFNGQEKFRARENWEQAEWRVHYPDQKELAVARTLMVSQRGTPDEPVSPSQGESAFD